MRVEVYVREKVLSMNVGVGSQRVRWLAEAATLRYQANSMFHTGEPKLVKLEDGSVLGMNERISDRLADNGRVWVLYEDLSAPQGSKDKPKRR